MFEKKENLYVFKDNVTPKYNWHQVVSIKDQFIVGLIKMRVSMAWLRVS